MYFAAELRILVYLSESLGRLGQNGGGGTGGHIFHWGPTVELPLKPLCTHKTDMLQESGAHSSDDVGRSSQHGDEPVPDAAGTSSDAATTEAGQQEPGHDDGCCQRGAPGRRGVPAPVPTSEMELLHHGGIQPRRINLRQDPQERQVDHVVMRGIGKTSVPVFECPFSLRA